MYLFNYKFSKRRQSDFISTNAVGSCTDHNNGNVRLGRMLTHKTQQQQQKQKHFYQILEKRKNPHKKILLIYLIYFNDNEKNTKEKKIILYTKKQLRSVWKREQNDD